MTSFATLCLGTTRESRLWNEQCTKLGFVQLFSSIRLHTPVQEIRDFFATNADWVLMSGHSGGDDLYGDTMPPYLEFKRDNSIAIMKDDDFKGRVEIKITDTDFRMRNVKVLCFAGCAIFAAPWVLSALRVIFGKPVILGTVYMTGRGYSTTMFGGLNASFPGFFARYADKNKGDPVAAWMETARSIYGGAPPDLKHPILDPLDKSPVSAEENFRALDATGQEWMIRGKQIIRGRTIA